MSDARPGRSLVVDDGLVTTRVLGIITQPSINVVTAPDGRVAGRPGQGGVVPGIGLGEQAGGWASDHLEPGVSLNHPDPDADRALNILACVGNVATVLDGAAAGARGLVYGKHGSVLAMFEATAIDRLAPGQRVSVDAVGVGASIADRPDVTVHSCDPGLLGALLGGTGSDGQLGVEVAAVLPREAAGAGTGMSAARYDIDVLVDQVSRADPAASLRFGDIVAIEGQDHGHLRAPRSGWLAIGIICHGRSVGGGHGLGLVTLLTGPTERFALTISADARLDHHVEPPWGIGP